MKTLYIVRHGKSAWNKPGLDDSERPLLQKGISRTRQVVGHLVQAQAKPDLILSSHAVRAFETAKIIAQGIEYPEEKIMVPNKIYSSDVEGIFELFYDLPDDIHSLMLVGHNPTLTDMANEFLTPKIDNLPTSGVVCVEFNTDSWESFFLTASQVKFVLIPKQLATLLKNRNRE